MKAHRCLAYCMALAALVLGMAAMPFIAGESVRAWADTGEGSQSLQAEAASSPDFYAVLHEDGSLVFQAQPSSEEGAVNYGGNLTSYLSGKAPWLASAPLIESVRFDESFAAIRPTSLQFWFIGCKNLTTIDLQNLDASASTSMRSMFSGCSSLTTIEHLETFDTSSSTYFGSMFRDCASLTSLDISHFDAKHVGVLCFMFAGCTKLETLNMAGEGWRTSSLFLMVHVWENCESLKSLDLSYLDTSGAHSMAKDFNGCSSLEYLDLSGADTSQVGSLEDMFNGCDKLTTVKLGPKFTFNGMSDAPQCSLPEGIWKSEATGIEYASADVPNNTADTYTRISTGGGDNPDPTDPAGDPSTDPSDESLYAPGEYDVPSLASSLGMFNHFVAGSQKLTVTEDRVTLAFTTDGSIQLIQKITKVAIGPSSKLANADDMKEGETKYVNSLLGSPMIFEGTLVSEPGEPKQYAYELEFAKPEFERMMREDGGIYLTLYQSEKNAWHKGDNDLLLTLGDANAHGDDGGDPAGEDPEGIALDSLDDSLADGTYAVGLSVLPSMVKLAGHDGLASEPMLVVSGDDAWLIVSYRSSLGSSWRYSQMTWGSYEETIAANADGVGGAPTFKEGKSAADGMSDEVLDAMTFTLPLSKAELIAWATSGEARAFTVRYVEHYNAEHDGDWWKASTQPTMALTSLRVAAEPAEATADYAAVLDALMDVPKDLSAYTDESVEKLGDALARVNGSPKPASQQNDVDAMAAAIAKAISELAPRNADAGEPAAEAAGTSTLTFDLGGGTLDGKTGSITIVANVGETIKLPDAPTKDGFTFTCWRGSEHAAGADYKVEGDHAFTAEWEANTTSSAPRTGDDAGAPVIPLAAAAGISLVVLIACALKRRAA